MMIAKGVPYGHNVWHNGRTITLTNNQSIIWNFLYGEFHTYEDIMKYILYLLRKNIQITKDVLKQTLLQLKSLDLLVFEDGTDNFVIFKILAKNKLLAISDDGIENSFDKKIYERIKGGKCITDIVVNMDNLNYKKLTNGKDDEYINFAYESIHTYSVINTIRDFLKRGNCCLV